MPRYVPPVAENESFHLFCDCCTCLWEGRDREDHPDCRVHGEHPQPCPVYQGVA